MLGSLVTSVGLERSQGLDPCRGKTFCFASPERPDRRWGLSRLLIQQMSEVLLQDLKIPVRELDHPPLQYPVALSTAIVYVEAIPFS